MSFLEPHNSLNFFPPKVVREFVTQLNSLTILFIVQHICLRLEVCSYVPALCVRSSSFREAYDRKKQQQDLLGLIKEAICIKLPNKRINMNDRVNINLSIVWNMRFYICGHWVVKLEREYGLGCKNAVELGQLAAGVMQMPNLAACGLDVLANMVEPLRLEKPTSVVFSDWGNQDLNKKQIKFAASNVFAYFKIGTKLVSGQISN
ncbi:hypothetical protein V6N11_077663 [Hibiscus sabdariffa]|uniref:Uncharacterized protein n=1 Tax=Hibiscus sabdariffa TaxID=183260 RepID=A0ABR2TEH1_9ROSI